MRAGSSPRDTVRQEDRLEVEKELNCWFEFRPVSDAKRLASHMQFQWLVSGQVEYGKSRVGFARAMRRS
jgi:hypothetical protein